MSAENEMYRLWVNWQEGIASPVAQAGFEPLCFCSGDSYRDNLNLLLQSGFLFCPEFG